MSGSRSPWNWIQQFLNPEHCWILAGIRFFQIDIKAALVMKIGNKSNPQKASESPSCRLYIYGRRQKLSNPETIGRLRQSCPCSLYGQITLILVQRPAAKFHSMLLTTVQILPRQHLISFTGASIVFCHWHVQQIHLHWDYFHIILSLSKRRIIVWIFRMDNIKETVCLRQSIKIS